MGIYIQTYIPTNLHKLHFFYLFWVVKKSAGEPPGPDAISIEVKGEVRGSDVKCGMNS